MPRFEWDPDKAEANRKKHDVSFEVAKDVFLDRNARGPELDDPQSAALRRTLAADWARVRQSSIRGIHGASPGCRTHHLDAA
jgi:uncharacterized DUF497 family protein